MRIRGRMISATLERETSPMYDLGRSTPIMVPGRTRMRIEIDVYEQDGYFGGAGDLVVIDTTPITPPAPNPTVERIQRLVRALEQDTPPAPPALASATPAELDQIARDVGLPRQPEPPKEPDPPPPPTRWNLLEID